MQITLLCCHKSVNGEAGRNSDLQPEYICSYRNRIRGEWSTLLHIYMQAHTGDYGKTEIKSSPLRGPWLRSETLCEKL